MKAGKKMKVFGLEFDYRLLALIPTILLIFSVVVLVNKYMTTGEWFSRSIELKGGTMITVKTDAPVKSDRLSGILSEDFGKVIVRGLRGFGEYGATIEMESSVNYTLVIDKLEQSGVGITDYSVENTGPSLSNVFWSQAQIAIIIAFILIWAVTFVVFRTVTTSMTTTFSAVSDLVVTLAFMQLMGIDFSLASLGALLMMLGYSVDTDMMLNSRLRKGEEKEVGERVGGALKTGLTMTMTSIAAVGALLFAPVPDALIQIASVLFIGLTVDILNTWLFNSVMLRWHFESRGEIHA